MEITENPYLNRTMIRDVKDFYGRSRETARIYSRIGTAHPQSVSIVGSRRIGKSSLLYFVYQEANREKYLRDHEKYKFAFIDFQERKKISLPEFFSALFELLSREFHRQIRIIEDPSYEGLKAVVSKIQDRGWKLILLFDEFDSITQNPNFDMEFFAFLRALANLYDVAYVMSSGRHLQDLCHTKDIADSPFFNIFSNLFLPPFSQSEAQKLIREPSQAAGYSLQSVEDQIISLAGYFPFFIQIACSAFFEYAMENPVPPQDAPVQEIQELFLEEASDHFGYIWDHSTPDQKEVLQEIAEDKKPHTSQQYLLRDLQRQGYIIMEKGIPRLLSNLFAEYIREQMLVPTHSVPAEQTQRMERIEQELQDARTMQRSILPSEDPDFTGLDISSFFRPATEIGGDYYDYIPISETKLAVAIGDVKGHGLPAGLLVSAASGCLHTTLETTQSVGEVMRVLNRRVREVRGRNYMSFCFSVLDISNLTATLSSAGHPLPYHYSAARQALVPWESTGTFPLGVQQECDCTVLSRSLHKGDVLIYYSDGLVEGTNADDQMFGFEGLEESIVRHGHKSSPELKEAILSDFSAHCKDYEQEDDVTLIVVKISQTLH